jgi:hypothetical protein
MEDADSARLSSVTPEVGLTGYLYKKTRNETWQKRFFKTQGFFLTYYKNRKMEKLLAALSLPQVGEIRLVDTHADGGTFAIELNTRVYILKANDRDTAEVWVSTLLRLREQGLAATAGKGASAPGTPTAAGTAASGTAPGAANAGWVKEEKKGGLCGFC